MMGFTVGDAYHNALMDTINDLYRPGASAPTVFHAGPYPTIAYVEYATSGRVDSYNQRRLHGTLGMISLWSSRPSTTRPSTESRPA